MGNKLIPKTLSSLTEGELDLAGSAAQEGGSVIKAIIDANVEKERIKAQREVLMDYNDKAYKVECRRIENERVERKHVLDDCRTVINQELERNNSNSALEALRIEAGFVNGKAPAHSRLNIKKQLDSNIPIDL